MDRGLLQVGHLHQGVNTRRIGRRIEHFRSTSSTNDEAWSRIDEPDVDGLVVFSEYQTAGRGRFGRLWQAPRGAGLLCSIVVVDRNERLTPGELALLSAVATCDAVRAVTDVKPTIKWPNDLMVQGRKLGGVLIESRVRADGHRAYVVGIGLNCLQQPGHLPQELAHHITSLEMESAHPVNRTAVACALIEALDRWLGDPNAWSFEDLRARWLERSDAPGQHVVLSCAGVEYVGIVTDLDATGALVVVLNDGRTKVFESGESTITTWGAAPGCGLTANQNGTAPSIAR